MATIRISAHLKAQFYRFGRIFAAGALSTGLADQFLSAGLTQHAVIIAAVAGVEALWRAYKPAIPGDAVFKFVKTSEFKALATAVETLEKDAVAKSAQTVVVTAPLNVAPTITESVAPLTI